MIALKSMGENARMASKELRKLSTLEKNKILLLAAEKLLSYKEEILCENQKDVDKAVENGIKGALIDRLTLTEPRIQAMADGLRAVARLQDPIGEVVSMRTLENGLIVGQKRVAMGVIGIIFEARPNVAADAFGLCFKAGNAVILRGGKEALLSNVAIVEAFRKCLNENGYNSDFVQLLTDTSHETAREMMRMNQFIDVLIPRGSASLIQTVLENSTVPVIETGVGNCHIFVDESADLANATAIIINAKTQRPGVCNACEKVLVHESIAEEYIPLLCKALLQKKVEIRGDERAIAICSNVILATEQEWGEEYLDFIIAIAVVKDVDDAICHIDRYSTGHSEAIITENYTNSQKFLDEIDSAAVYVNASTRFTDGAEFGLGAEIGISTQKLHARGPMGLKELTTTKYIIYGSGQTRE